ncbi:MAG: acyl-CoA dehydrogenase family protein [Acidimicrobiales bacterium]
MSDTAPTTGEDEQPMEEYRRRARAWLAANVPRRDGPVEAHRIGYYTPDVMAANRSLQRRLFEAGYAGITWPREYGGQGLPTAYELAFLQEAAPYAMPDFGALSGTTFSVCVPTMLAHATPEFLRHFVPRVMAGEALVCQFFSEPTSGSDLAGARTRATRDGEQWVLNGQKIWSTFAHLADWGMCLARTDWDVPKHRGLTWFAVPCDAPGLTIRPIQQINEIAEFCEEFFDDVAVPAHHRIGEVNEGWAVTQTMLVFERGAGRPVDALPMAGPGPLAPDLVRLARQVGRLDDPIVRQKLARAHTNEFVGRALTRRIAQMGSLGPLNPGLASYVKLFLGTYTPMRARIGVEIGGGSAMTWDPEVPQGAETSLAYLSGRGTAIAGGTNEMQRNVIAERALGLPREPSVDAHRPFSEVLRDAGNWTSPP